MFWSMAYAGSQAIDMGWFWELPVLTRVFSGLVCLTGNAYGATTNQPQVFGCSPGCRGLLWRLFRPSNPGPLLSALEGNRLRNRRYVFLALYCRLFTIITHLKLLGHGGMPAVLLFLATLAATEFGCLLRAAYELEKAMEADDFIARMNKCARSSLLAGCTVPCDLGKGLNEALGENECIRTT